MTLPLSPQHFSGGKIIGLTNYYNIFGARFSKHVHSVMLVKNECSFEQGSWETSVLFNDVGMPGEREL